MNSDKSYLVMLRSEKRFVIDVTFGGEHGLVLAQEYCRRRNWRDSESGADLVIYQLVEVDDGQEPREEEVE